MTKNIEWMKKWLDEYEDEIVSWLGDKYTGDYLSARLHGSLSAIKDIEEKLNQLDEPEVLSEEWISENVEYAYFDILDGSGRLSSATAIIKPKKLQNLLVPKQEVNLKVQELIEKYEQEDGEHSNPENAWIDDFIYDLEHLLEEEKRYVVVDSKGSYILAKIKGEIMTMGEILEFYGHESVDIDYNLTEQEIKGYDPRYWAFRKPVEELEG